MNRRALLCFRFFKDNIIILKSFISLNRQIKARMTAHRVRHRYISCVFDLKFSRYTASGQNIRNCKSEIKRIEFLGLFIRTKFQYNSVFTLISYCKFTAASKAVTTHFIPKTVDFCTVASERTDNREQHRCMSSPVFAIALPNVLKAILTYKRYKLRTECLYRCGYIFIFNGDQHNRKPFPYLSFRIYFFVHKDQSGLII